MIFVVMIVVVMVAALMIFVVMIVVVMMAAAVLIVVMVVMALSSLLCLLKELLHGIIVLFHYLKELCAGELLHRSGYYLRLCVYRPQKLHVSAYLVRSHHICAAKDYGSRILYLVIEEFSEVLHIELAFVGVHHGDSRIKLHLKAGSCSIHCLHDIGELSHT